MPNEHCYRWNLALAIAGVLILTANAQAGPPQAAPATAVPSPSAYLSRIDFAAGTLTPWPDVGPPVQAIDGDVGAGADARSALPRHGPSLPVRGSHFSTLLRARDVVDVSTYPARVVAKLYRLDEDGQRQGTACTAQFVGPRHLLTAAHCLMDRTTGKPHAGFEVAVRYDAGRHHGILPVIEGWLPTSETAIRPPIVHLDKKPDWGADCHDWALIEVEQPIAGLGWLGMSSSAAPGAILHRFSYPNESSTVAIERQSRDTTQPKEVQDYLRAELVNARRTEPDFSPDSLYYEYGPADQVGSESLSERTGAVLPGRSGSALVEDNGHALAVMSIAVQGVNYSCRLTPQLIGAFARIASVRR